MEKNGNCMEQQIEEMTYTAAQHEREMTRLETQAKRWFIAFLIVLVMLFGTNLAWVIYEFQYEDIVVTNDVDTGEGDATVFGSGTGDIYYGEGETDDTGAR